MRVIKNILTSLLSIVIWGIVVLIGYIGSLLLFVLILGPDTGGRSEVLRVLNATGVAGILTIGEIFLLFKWKQIFQAISVSIVALVVGGCHLWLIFAFGHEYLFPN
jgi:hypothetical protein